MAIESDGDRLAFVEAFGETVQVEGNDISGILDRTFLEVLEVESYHPVLVVRDIDLSGVTAGASVLAGGKEYQVVQVQPDGTGITALVMRES